MTPWELLSFHVPSALPGSCSFPSTLPHSQQGLLISQRSNQKRMSEVTASKSTDLPTPNAMLSTFPLRGCRTPTHTSLCQGPWERRGRGYLGKATWLFIEPPLSVLAACQTFSKHNPWRIERHPLAHAHKTSRNSEHWRHAYHVAGITQNMLSVWTHSS